MKTLSFPHLRWLIMLSHRLFFSVDARAASQSETAVDLLSWLEPPQGERRASSSAVP